MFVSFVSVLFVWVLLMMLLFRPLRCRPRVSDPNFALDEEVGKGNVAARRRNLRETMVY